MTRIYKLKKMALIELFLIRVNSVISVISGKGWFLFLAIARRHIDRWFPQRDDRALAGIGVGVAGAERNFILHKADKFLHLAVHVFHALTHLQNNSYAG